MVEEAVGRVALMSIHPAYAHAILEGRKTVEFRKRRLAADVTHVVIYSTAPDQAVVGYFAVEGQETTAPASLWRDFHTQGGVISEDDFFAYYAGRSQATGIKVGEATRLRNVLSLNDLGVVHPPQSFQYLSHDRFAKVLAAV